MAMNVPDSNNFGMDIWSRLKNNSLSPEMRMGLLQAGLGILANNTGYYGQAGPAIGKGGLLGAEGYNNAVKLKMLKQRQEQDRKYQEGVLGIRNDALDFEKRQYQDAEDMRRGRVNYGQSAAAAPQVNAPPPGGIPGVVQSPESNVPSPAAPVVQMPQTTGGMFKQNAEPEIFALGQESAQNNVTPPTSAGLDTNFGFGQVPQQTAAPQQQQSFISSAIENVRGGGSPSNRFTSEIDRWGKIAADAKAAGDTEYEKMALEERRRAQLALKENFDMRKSMFDMTQGRTKPVAGTTGFFTTYDEEGKFTGLVGINDKGEPYLVSTNQVYAKELERAEKGATRVSQSVQGAGEQEDAYMKKSGTQDAEQTKEMEKSADAAYKNSAALDRFIKNSDKAGAGLLQPALSLAQNFFASFGFNPKSLKSTDDMQSALNSILESKMEEFGARGLTDQDMKILREELPKINTSKESRVNVAKIMQKAFDNDIREFDNRLKQEKELYPQRKQMIPSWLKSWRMRAIPQSALDYGLTQPDWDDMSAAEKKAFR